MQGLKNVGSGKTWRVVVPGMFQGYGSGCLGTAIEVYAVWVPFGALAAADPESVHTDRPGDATLAGGGAGVF